MTRALLALGSVEWEPRLVAMLSHPMSGIVVERRCLDGVDVRAAVRVSRVDVVVVTDATLRVDADMVNEVRAAGCSLVALSDDVATWLALGATHVFPADPGDLSAVVRLLAVAARDEPPLPAPDAASRGTLVAVGGYGGGAGRSTVALELAFALTHVAGGLDVLIADADTYGPALGQMLGVEDQSRGILTACRAVEGRELVMGQHVTDVHSRLVALQGLPRASRWTDVRLPALRALWDAARTTFGISVVDVGPVLDVEPALRVESALPVRQAAMLTAIDACETVVLCARADPVGVTRLIRGFIDSDHFLDDKRVEVVVSGVHSRSHAKDVIHAVTRHTGLSSVHTVPLVPDVVRKAAAHTTFASLLDKSVARTFEDLARAVRPGAAPGISAVDDYLRAA